MLVRPATCSEGGSVTIFHRLSIPIIYARRKLEMIKEIMKNIEYFEYFFNIFLPVQGEASSFLCSLASPSSQYSILRNTISSRTVCGQIHPQNTLPKTAVNRIIKTINAIAANPNK